MGYMKTKSIELRNTKKYLEEYILEMGNKSTPEQTGYYILGMGAAISSLQLGEKIDCIDEKQLLDYLEKPW